MQTYKISFNGRLVGAIGITYPITTIVQADTEDAAILELYKKYGHILVSSVSIIE